MKKYIQIIAFIKANKSYPSNDMKGRFQNVSLSLDWVDVVFELSILIGKMQVYFDREDTENFNYMEMALLKNCRENDIDMEEFEEWYESVKDDQDCDDEENCATCK